MPSSSTYFGGSGACLPTSSMNCVVTLAAPSNALARTGAPAPPLTGGISASSSPSARVASSSRVLAVDGHHDRHARDQVREPVLRARPRRPRRAPSRRRHLDRHRLAAGTLAQHREQAHVDEHGQMLVRAAGLRAERVVARRRRVDRRLAALAHACGRVPCAGPAVPVARLERDPVDAPVAAAGRAPRAGAPVCGARLERRASGARRPARPA